MNFKSIKTAVQDNKKNASNIKVKVIEILTGEISCEKNFGDVVCIFYCCKQCV